MMIKMITEIVALYQSVNNPITVFYLWNKLLKIYDVEYPDLIEILENLVKLEIIKLERVHNTYHRVIIDEKMQALFQI